MTKILSRMRFPAIFLTIILSPAARSEDEVSEAEVQLNEAKAQLIKAEANLAKAKKISELRKQLAELEGPLAQPVSTDGKTAGAQPAITAQPSSPLPPIAKKSASETSSAVAESDNEAVSPKAIQAAADLQKAAKIEEANRKFGGLELGTGLSFTLDVGNRDRVTDANLVNNIVRIRNADNVRARIMLESHYFFRPNRKFLGLDPNMWGVGPFIAVQPGSDEIIEAIGLGAMIGFRRLPEESSSFNFGIGVVFDPNTQVLGDGIVPNRPLPSGETEVRFKEDSQMGIMAIASFTF